MLSLANNTIEALPQEFFTLKDTGGDHRRSRILRSVSLANNRLTEMPNLDAALHSLHELDLHGNQLSEVTAACRVSDMEQLTGIDLSRNEISVVEAGALASKRLRMVSLSHNQLTSIESGAFGPSLDHVWLTANVNLTCAGAEGSGVLPSGAECIDDGWCDAKWGVANVGNGYCDENFDPLYNTEACIWDAGECETASLA